MCEILLTHPILYLPILFSASIAENQAPGSAGGPYSQSGYGIISSGHQKVCITQLTKMP